MTKRKTPPPEPEAEPESAAVHVPAGDFFEQVAEAAAEDLPKILSRMREVAEGGGRKEVRFKCASCGQYHTEMVDIYDPEDLRKLMESYASIQLRAKAAKTDPDSSVEGR